MTALPAKDDLAPVGAGPAGPTRAALRQLHDFLRERPGFEVVSPLVIAAGTISPNRGVITVDTEGATATDDLTNIVTTNITDGAFVYVSNLSLGKTVVVKHANGGAGQILLTDLADLVLSDPTQVLVLQRRGADLREVDRFYGNNKPAHRSFWGTGTPVPTPASAADFGKVPQVNAAGTGLELVSAMTGFKNRIINGDMRHDQRNTGAAVNVGASSQYVLDRWLVQASGGGVITVQQVAAGGYGDGTFSHAQSLLVQTVDAAIAAADAYTIQQRIEGFNVADAAFGAVGAKSVALSFWVNASLAGTYGGGVTNDALNRSFAFTYTINAANTWEKKTVVIPGDVAGVWRKDNGSGLLLVLDLGSGANFNGVAGAWQAGNFFRAAGCVNWIGGGAGARAFLLTGVQVEVGDKVTAWEFRSFAQERALCDRYFETAPVFARATMSGPAGFGVQSYWKVRKRASPTMTSNITYVGCVSSSVVGDVGGTQVVASLPVSADASITGTVTGNSEL